MDTSALSGLLLSLCLGMACLLMSPAPCHGDDTQESRINITHDIGKDAKFTCSLKDLGRRQLIWRRLSDPYPISVGSRRFVPDRRYSASKVSPNAYTLTIKDVGVKDAGEYECRVSGQEGLSDIITLNVKGGPRRPYLKQTETVVKAAEGSSVLLPCEVENLGSKSVLWKNEKNEVLTLRRKNHIGDRELRIIHDTAPQWSLQIQKVQKWHYGYYTCLINANPVLTRTVLLKQMVAPHFSPKLIRNSAYQLDTSVKAGDTLTLTCKFRSNPPAKVSWYRRYTANGEAKKEVLGGGSQLTLRSVRPEQSGTYFCVGKNGVEPNGRGRTKVVIEEPTTTVPPTTTTTMLVPTGPVAPHMYHMGNEYNVSRGNDVTMKCIAISQPQSYIHWHRHGHRISSDHKYLITQRAFGRFNFTSVLTVRALGNRDFGEYKCMGYNDLGVTGLVFKVNKKT